jgi:hypothetical protein
MKFGTGVQDKEGKTVYFNFLGKDSIAYQNLLKIRPEDEDEAQIGLILYQTGFKLNLFGNEVYYTAHSSLVILNNSCSKLHCQKVLI